MLAIFIYCYDWTFLALTIHNLRMIITDPIDGILKPNSRLKAYVLIAFIVAFVTTILSYMAKVFGRSVYIIS
jgi:hypothetical protein